MNKNIKTTKRPTGRPLKLEINSFKETVQQYLADMQENNGLPTLVGLSLRLGVSNDTLSGTYGKMPRFAEELKRVKEIASEKIITKLMSTEKPLINHIFLAKAIAGLRDNADLSGNGVFELKGVVKLPKRG